MGFDLAMKNAGIQVIKTQVGDRYILEEIIKRGYNFGGEQSGHLIFWDYATTGDGILAALQVLAVIKKKGKFLSELSKVMETLPQCLLNVTTKNKKDLDSIGIVKRAIDSAEKKLNGRGRVLVRYSGTQPICRIMVEGPSKQEILKIAQDLAEILKKHLN